MPFTFVTDLKIVVFVLDTYSCTHRSRSIVLNVITLGGVILEDGICIRAEEGHAVEHHRVCRGKSVVEVEG